jgi:3'-phosphoadenosine 5'-phosphosulfate sulfotransferase (PAPS reductase)/FAD synthetase
MLILRRPESKPALLLKAVVPGHMRHDQSGITYVRPYVTRAPGAHKDARQADLFATPQHIDIKPTGRGIDVPGLDLASYDHILVGFSGGKDSIASVVALLEAGVPKQKIELWHHDVDGGGETFMDWPITPAYVRAVGKALGIPVYFSYREGGIKREMLRQNQPTAGVVFDKPGGEQGHGGGVSNKLGTRLMFPQVGADLKTRWCSGSAKIDVMDIAIRNQIRFLGKRTLVVTGERAEESSNRAKYKEFEVHRAASKGRHVDVLRPVHGWKEAEVWDAMRRHGIRAHPAYEIGYSRLSCRNCIFGNEDQWATNRTFFPGTVVQVAGYEKQFNKTIHRTEDVMTRAAKGKPYDAAVKNPDLVKLADSHEWHGPVVMPPSQWKMPAGAFGHSGGPT